VKSAGFSINISNLSAYRDIGVGQATEANSAGVEGGSRRGGTTTGRLGGAAARTGMR
jgi:hypothetical protein